MDVMDSVATGLVDPAIFERLQASIDGDARVREELRNILQRRERQGRITQSLLSRAHSVPAAELGEALKPAWSSILEQIKIIKEIEAVASQHPYYKYNSIWTSDVRDTILAVIWCVWLGAGGKPQGSLPTIEDVGSLLNVPANVTDGDVFHITTEEYLHAVISLIEELARLAVNSVTLGDYQRPLQISKFVKDVHAGFQILNLKNDSLRRRSDSIKYNVKKIEDVVYDLSLRNLIPRNTS
ncbi:MAG: hypothetical protein L6R40_005811 [Gallowayella cf. fulva]|nr:MAG: hypothetical protein L6R40_005811 [Xanthomendoza cf. fulva]